MPRKVSKSNWGMTHGRFGDVDEKHYYGKSYECVSSNRNILHTQSIYISLRNSYWSVHYIIHSCVIVF